MSETIRFQVDGKPQPAGSKRAFMHPKTGRAIVTDANAKSKPWQAEVKAAAREVFQGPPLTGPIMLELEFTVSRPKGHFGTGRNAMSLKPSAPKLPTVKPDLLKLARGIEDALTGVVYRDDSQIVDESLVKFYGDRDRVCVTVRTFGGDLA